MPADLRRHLPAVDALAASLAEHLEQPPAALHRACARHALASWRQRLAAPGSQAPGTPAALAAAVLASTIQRWQRLTADPLPRVINATGTVLHTGLGRAPLSERAQAAARRVARGYCQLEFDLETGRRGDRQDHVGALLCELTGAEDALVVNNCAGATVLMLQALAQHREVVVSRGELVEIGGSFRVPEIMACAGCRLVEVGATNKTHRRDYAAAIGADTALLLKVHRSNFDQVGFVAAVATEELVALGRAHGLPVGVDQGSGCVTDLTAAGYATPRVTEELRAGAAVVACSGDKLLGGPQAGILLGESHIIRRCAKHPLARALRCDKVTLALLAATLQDHLLEDACEAVPSLAMLTAPLADIRARAERLVAGVEDVLPCDLVECRGAVGSGALPTDGPASVAVAPRLREVEATHAALRTGSPAVVGRIQDGRLLLDCCTVADAEIDALIDRLRSLVG